ncbi:hypothetical protein RB200_07330 [Streptomyces sp. PmtG]
MRTLFRHLLEQRDVRSYSDFVPLYQMVAERLREAAQPSKTTFEAWFYKGRRPMKTYRRVLEVMLGYSFEQLWREVPGEEPVFTPIRTSPPLHADPGVDLIDMKRMGAMAAARAREFLLGADQARPGDDTLDLLNDEVRRLVRDYPRKPLSTLWPDLLQTQAEVFRILESGRVRPTQLRDLNFSGAVLSFLVAKGFNDIEDRDQAMIMTRVAAACARDAEHTGLIALIEGLKSLISYWADQPSAALHYARQGSETATNLRGTVGPWLLGLQSRAAAALGDAQTSRAASQQAADLRDRVVPDDLDELGGLLTYTPEKQQYYTVEAEALLGHGNADLTAQAEQATEAFADQDAPYWAFGDEAGVRCDLALLRLYAGDLEGTAEALRWVLELPYSHRNNGIVVSAQRVRHAIMAGPARDAVLAQRLREEIEVFPPTRPALPR